MPPFEVEYDVSDGYVEMKVETKKTFWGKTYQLITIIDEETGAVHKMKTDEAVEMVYTKGGRYS